MKMSTEDQKFVMSVASILKALGDPNRLRILMCLSAYAEGQPCVNDLSRILGISQPAVSQHIKVLKGIGLVEPRKRGFHVYHRIDADRLALMKGQVDAMLTLVGKKCPESG
jgi:ArsR family transcriptional regulator